MTFCHVCWKNKGYELGSFSRLRMPDAFSFFCMSTEFQPHVFFETNRKQTTNLYKSVFDVFERSAILVPKKQQQFFLPWNVKGHSNRDVCGVHPHIFHLKEAQRSQAWFKQESKQRTGNKLRLCCFLRFAGAKVGT